MAMDQPPGISSTVCGGALNAAVEDLLEPPSVISKVSPKAAISESFMCRSLFKFLYYKSSMAFVFPSSWFKKGKQNCSSTHIDLYTALPNT
jgi:hypothetical protein